MDEEGAERAVPVMTEFNKAKPYHQPLGPQLSQLSVLSQEGIQTRSYRPTRRNPVTWKTYLCGTTIFLAMMSGFVLLLLFGPEE